MFKYFSFLLFIVTSTFPNSGYSQTGRQLIKEQQQPSISERYPKIEGGSAAESYQQPATTGQRKTSSPQQPTATTQQQAEIQRMLKESSSAAETWLNLIDQENYGASWDTASEIFKVTIPKGDWVKLMGRIRQPYGRSISREVIDQRIAIDPKGLPRGDYMVLIYNTTFANKPSGVELVTLRNERGQWKVLTYQVK